MPIRPAVIALVGVLMATALPAPAQQGLTQSDSPQAQLRTTLRAFYFSLAHRDWNALSVNILPAKVVAHRTAPEALVSPPRAARPVRLIGSAPATDGASGCGSKAGPLVEEATIRLEGDWAEVWVRRCAATSIGADRFRFVHFDGRWWIVHIDLAG
ncbi:MAG: hypothetical protein H0V09_08920 [Gemmatimonadetes bacterium]|nr:hypothetical protein [Gemmatimonadota bacterium]